MQKNKFIHEDIKAVCSSATKKLVAAGLIAATTVGGANFTSNNCKNIASAQPPEGNEPNKPEEKKLRYLTKEEAEEVIAKGLGNYSSWGDWCADNNIAYDAPFFGADAEKLALFHQRFMIEFGNEVNAFCHKELGKKTERETIKSVANIEENQKSLSKLSDEFDALYEEANEEARKTTIIEIFENEKFLLNLRGKEKEIEEQLKSKNEEIHKLKKEKDRQAVQREALALENQFNRIKQIDTLIDSLCSRKGKSLKALKNKINALEEMANLQEKTVTRIANSLNDIFVKPLPHDESVDDENQMKKLEQYVEQYTLEVETEQKNSEEEKKEIQRLLEQCLEFEQNSQIFGEDIIDGSITITREEFERSIPGNQLRGEGILVERPEHNNQIDDCQMQNDNNMIHNNQIQEVEDYNPENNNQQQRQPINILSVRPIPNQPTPQQGNDLVRETIDLNMINNNQIQEIVEIRDVVEEPEDLNMINNNQIQEIVEIREVEEHNPENNNQQQQPILHIAPLNPPVRQIIQETLNQPTPQQGNALVRGTIKVISNALSVFNPFNK